MSLRVHFKPKSIADATVTWLVTNAKSLSYLLPDSLELALYLGLAAYFTFQVIQQQA